MTSVQNRLQQLSGNKIKYYFSFCLVIFILSSCNIFKKSQRNNDVIILEPHKSDSSTAKNKNDKDSLAAENATKTEAKGKSWAKKDVYNIAFILPFEMDAIELNTLLGEGKVTGYQPLASIEFYEGALIALDSLKTLGVNLNVFIYDNIKDDSATSLLFAKPEMKTMDLIVGPMFNQSLKIAADFAKKNEIFLVSPLSPSNNITTDNRYYLIANATLKMQLKKTLEFFYRSDPNANVIVVYRTDKDAESKIGKEFLSCFRADSVLKTDHKIIEVNSASGVSSNIKTGVKNYIFIASTDELFVNGLIRSLSTMSRGNENINIVGMPGLMDMESISIDYYESLNFHYPTAYWIDPNAPRTERFINSFENKYETYPSDFAFRGYDLTFYFGQLLKVYGPDITSNLDKYITLKSPLYRFHFVPHTDENNNLKFYENENVVILKYDNYRFEKVN
ncbi:MAG: amino acid ABC transporter substrate-binding protein [Fimbriimonadaceae bacterium]|nr:amino acid ABC transporter substrate-binding protein [Chitinophagales bacterium]